MNHLKGQLSPYLEQHVNNPVDWYPWGEEAFAKARAENKPVFLSIGYSTCHWCHVMAHESFEDEEVAAYLNAHYVSVKVDREERPDIDSLYMSVCQAMTGSGGWPLTIIMDGDQHPFYAATYLPKHGRYGQPGLLDLLAGIHELWEKAPEELANRQSAVVDFLQRQGTDQAEMAHKLDRALLEEGVTQAREQFDEAFGGFGSAPKFPIPHRLYFLQHMGVLGEDPEALEMVRTTLDGMARGGIFDHVGGGFARYSTDGRWLVPHFEKMMYDNALLAIAYIRQYQIDGNAYYRYVAEATLGFITREMTSAEGGFFSALDADSEGREGAFYMFRPEEVRGLLPADSAERIIDYFQLTEAGNFEGSNVLNVLHREALTIPDQVLQEDLALLLQAREERMALHVDDKQLLGWTALAIKAFATVYEVTGEPQYLKTARDARAFIEEKLRQEDGTYALHFRKGQGTGAAQLEDYAFLAGADLALYRATAENADLRSALDILEQIEELFLDAEQGGYFMTARHEEVLIVRPKEWYDGAMMCGNSTMVGLLNDAYAYTANVNYRERLDKLLLAFARQRRLSVLSHGYFYCMLSEVLAPRRELVVTYNHTEELDPWFTFQSAHPLFHTLLLAIDKETEGILGAYSELVQSFPRDQEARWYLCRNHSCQQPERTFEALKEKLLERDAL